jgi:hypothetical protein
MDRVNSRIAQGYGYAVCFITVIVMLIAIKAVVDAAFDLSDPIRAEGSGLGRMGRPLTSFELYRIEARRQGPRGDQIGPSSAAQRTALPDSGASDAELRRMFDAEHDAAIGNARFHAIRSLVGNILLILLAGVLFGIHWRWLKERDSMPAPV